MEWWSTAKYQIPRSKSQVVRALGFPPEVDQVLGVRKKKNQG
jgi:hypothetical protein